MQRKLTYKKHDSAARLWRDPTGILFQPSNDTEVTSYWDLVVPTIATILYVWAGYSAMDALIRLL